MIYLVFMLLLISSGSLGLSTTSGKEFLITFLENKMSSATIPMRQCVTLTTSHEENIPVQVASLFPDINFNTSVIINNANSKYICLDNSIKQEGTQVTKKIVKILANQNISVMVHDHEVHSTDSYMAIPVENYGTEYYITNFWGQSLLSVTTKESDTTVNIKFPIGETSGNYEVNYNGFTFLNPSNLVLTLQEHEVFHLHINHGLTGVYVSSNKPVAVVSGNKKIYLYQTGSRDHLAEQMPPVDTWGTHFTSVPTPSKTGTDVYTILASSPCTSVKVGNTTYRLENEGDKIRIILSSVNVFGIVSNKPVLVTKAITRSTFVDQCMMLMVPRRQWLNHYTFRFPQISNNGGYLILVVESRFRTSILLNGETVNIPQWIEVDNTNLSVGYILLPNALYILYLPETDGYFTAYIQHSQNRFAYCTSIGMKLDKINMGWTHTESDTSCTETTTSPTESSEETILNSTYTTDQFTTEATTFDFTSVPTTDETNVSETLSVDSNLTSPPPESCLATNPQLMNLSVTDEELLNIIEELKHHLMVDPQETSQAIRKKISVPDYRLSYTAIGISWWIVVFLGFSFGFLASDILQLVKDFRYGFRRKVPGKTNEATKDSTP